MVQTSLKRFIEFGKLHGNRKLFIVVDDNVSWMALWIHTILRRNQEEKHI